MRKESYQWDNLENPWSLNTNPHFKHFCISVWLPSLKMTTTSWKACLYSGPVVDVSFILLDSCLEFSFQLKIKTNNKHNSTQHNTQYSEILCAWQIVTLTTGVHATLPFRDVLVRCACVREEVNVSQSCKWHLKCLLCD